MRDPFSWSFPIGRLFGVTVRVHVLFLVFALGTVLRVAFWVPPRAHPEDKIADGTWIDISVILAFLFLSVLAHEFGHVFGARSVGGDCQEILMWPLGGLAFVEGTNSPRASFLTAAAGPAVNLLLAGICVVLLLFVHGQALQPHWWWPTEPFITRGTGLIPNQPVDPGQVPMLTWSGQQIQVPPFHPANLLNWMFRVNYVLFLLNIVLVGFPMDAGRMLQSALWARVGYRQATLMAVFAGFVTAVVVGVFAMWQYDFLALCLCLFIAWACKNQWMILETGGEDPLMGHYDFSQGYTSLERDEPPAPRVRRQSWWKRWMTQRAAKKMQRELEQREAEERRMDELLDKIQRQGRDSLTSEEQRFLKRVSERYRNRH